MVQIDLSEIKSKSSSNYSELVSVCGDLTPNPNVLKAVKAGEQHDDGGENQDENEVDSASAD